MRVHNLRAIRNRSAGRWPCGGNLSVFQYHYRILNRRFTGAVNQPAAHNRRHRCRLCRKPCRDFSQVGHSIACGTGHKSCKAVLVAIRHGFKVVHFGIHAHQRDQVVLRIQPQRFHSPDQPSYR